MKKTNKRRYVISLIGLILCVTALNASATYTCDPALSLTLEEEKPFSFGFNYKQNWIPPQGEWKRILVRTQPGFDVYFGWRFHPFFGVDAGYEWTADKPLTIAINPRESLLGAVNNTNQIMTLTGKVRYKTIRSDLNAFIPLNIPFYCNYFPELPEGIITVGVAGTRPGVKIHTMPVNGPVTRAVQLYQGTFNQINGRSFAVFRFGLGFQTILIENVGIRFIWRYETTGVLRVRDSFIAKAPATRKVFGNCYSLALGFYIRF